MQERDSVKTDKAAAKPEPVKGSSLSWQDSLLKEYVRLCSNGLVKTARENKQAEEWLFDQTIQTDSADYLVYQVGHDVTDEGGANPRFVTDQWVYIDTVTRKLYEYDLPNDSLVVWKG